MRPWKSLAVLDLICFQISYCSSKGVWIGQKQRVLKGPWRARSDATSSAPHMFLTRCLSKIFLQTISTNTWLPFSAICFPLSFIVKPQLRKKEVHVQKDSAPSFFTVWNWKHIQQKEQTILYKSSLMRVYDSNYLARSRELFPEWIGSAAGVLAITAKL